jgi:phosphoribosylformylglycinamidine cyclo-ligase
MYDTTKPYKKQILELVKQTWETPYISLKEGVVKEKFNYGKYRHVDGIGTKGIYLYEQEYLEGAVIDAMAMNLNDLLMVRATPYEIVDHLFYPEDDKEAILETIGYLVKECKKRDIAITGGETAIHNNMKGLELSITMLGFIKKPELNKFEVGDVLIGVESNGLHSNGFTKVREILGEDYQKYINELIKPTLIYSDSILELIENVEIHGMQHITGGAFTKLKDLLKGCNALITKEHNLEPQEIFKELYGKGISDAEMYKTFNCGIGFVLGAPEYEVDKIISEIKSIKSGVIGRIISGSGKVKIESKFSDKEIKY